MAPLQPTDLKTAASALAQKLDSLSIDYAIMGGAAACLLTNDPGRTTEDIDLVIHVDDERMITADRLIGLLLTSFPAEFVGISQFGHTVPAYKLCRRPEDADADADGAVQLVQLEFFDYKSWPQRPQYRDIQAATRKTLNIQGQAVKVFGPEWILREKIVVQYQRQGSVKEESDIRDIVNMIPLAVAGRPELDFDGDDNSQDLRAALENFVQKRPGLVRALKAKVKCSAVFQN